MYAYEHYVFWKNMHTFPPNFNIKCELDLSLITDTQ